LAAQIKVVLHVGGLRRVSRRDDRNKEPPA
jgi:hypothetical protein